MAKSMRAAASMAGGGAATPGSMLGMSGTGFGASMGATTSGHGAVAAAANGGMRSRMALVTTTTRLPSGASAAAAAAAASSGDGGGSDLPPAVLAEKQVLRFFAWFREAVPESRMETNRVRHVRSAVRRPRRTSRPLVRVGASCRCSPERPFEPPPLPPPPFLPQVRRVTILFFVETGDIAIHEPRTANSGLPQGPVARKARIVKREREDGSREYMDWRDLSVSDEVTIHGTTYRVDDADGFTREWFAARGLPLAEPEGVPADVYAAAEAEAALAATIPGRHRKRMYDEKLFQEARRGKFVRDPAARGRFQDNDGKVLRFDCVWSDKREGGDVLHYVLQWHLKDDQAELLEVHDRNDGRDPTRVAVSKRRLPKNWRATLRMPGDISAEAAENWATPMDIIVGADVDVFGRTLFVRGADGFTRSWYRDTHGFEQPAARYQRELEPELPSLPPPPHMGIGDPEDTIQSTKTFAPKPPKRDFDRWATFEGVVYRFKARIIVPEAMSHVADADRRFTVALYPMDDTLGIFEPPRRNSGQSAGKFLSRGKHRHPSGRPYRPTDFLPGSTVIINTRTFHVDDADPFTRRAVPEVDRPVPDAGRDNMFPRGPTTTSLDGTMKAVTVGASA